MRAFVALFVAAFACVATTACYTTRAELPGALRNDVQAGDLQKVGVLDVEVEHTFFLGGFVGTTTPEFLAAPIRKQVQARGADGVANVVYESEQGCGDFALSTCTLGCFAPRTYRVRGDIVRIRAPRLAGRPAKLVENDARDPVDVADDRDARVVAQRY
jgi:hypothetical protein